MILFGNLGVLNFFVANLVAGLYLLVCLAVIVMYSSFFKSQLAAGGMAMVSLIGLAATSGLPVLKDYSPSALLAWAQRIASGSGPSTWGALIAATHSRHSSGNPMYTHRAWQVFKRKELR